MKTRGFLSAFIRMRSPSSAPPVFFRVGSIASTAMRVDLSRSNSRITSSSVRLDFPAPPVPVIPTMNPFLGLVSTSVFNSSKSFLWDATSLGIVSASSIAVSACASDRRLESNCPSFSQSVWATGEMSARLNMSLMMP